MSWGVWEISARYGDRPALEGVTLEPRPGSIAAVVGADGAGKTTLLRVLAGARDADAGEVRRPAPERLGFVSQGSGVYEDLTVAENLAFAARAYGVEGHDDRAAELLATTGLAEARERLGSQLSGGMRQKLGVAMAMVHRPDLLVLDEPTTGLDPVSRVELWTMVAAAAAEGAAVVVSTAYLEEAERATHVLVLDEGRPLVSGSPEEVLSSVPGVVLEVPTRPEDVPSWRRGRTWRAWIREGDPPRGALRVAPDIDDAVMVAALSRARP
ncbi:MAG TPA: ABC transporter ATP-binding protein [Actinomycetota bacterium]